MSQQTAEKRRHPRIDTSGEEAWRIKIFGLNGKPIEVQILNLSVGGVAFVSHWKDAAKTVKRFTTKVEIRTPSGEKVNANSNFVRILPSLNSDECVCVLQLLDMTTKHVVTLQTSIGLN